MNNTELTLHQQSEIAGGPHIRTLPGSSFMTKAVIHPDHKYRNLEAFMSSGGSPGPYLPGPSYKKR